jgi:tRNA-2-methylthio-N6-dimethylallyladenosine synthase
MEYVKYNFGYMYSYSERPGTLAGRKMEDDVPKKPNEDCRKLSIYNKNMLGFAREFIGQTVEVL